MHWHQGGTVSQGHTIRRAVDEDLADVVHLLGGRVGASPLSEYKVRALRGEVPGRGVVVHDPDGDRLVGYAQAARHDTASSPHWAVEMVLHPDVPASISVELVSYVRGLVEGDVTVWTSDDQEEQALIAAGEAVLRRLDRMEVDLPVSIRSELPDGIELRPFRRTQDEAAWLGVNNRAFADHRENSGVTPAELRARMELQWFDPDDLLMAWAGDRLAGSCWTKVHPTGVGEIYIIGVDPPWQGSGLGAALLGAGFDHLAAERGCSRALLYTDVDNEAAVATYRSVGMRTVQSSVELGRADD